MIPTSTNSGLHDFVAEEVLCRYARRGVRAIDLGCGPGAMAERLRAMDCEVLGVDRNADTFQAKVAHALVDLNREDFATLLGAHLFDIVTAIEVIEHLESPIGFLRNIARLLAPAGVAVVTTPNLDSLPARLKFLLAGRIRTMDALGEPTHITPIFLDLMRRQFLPRAGLRLREHLVFPRDGFQLSRPLVAWVMGLAASLFPGECTLGDNHVFVLETVP